MTLVPQEATTHRLRRNRQVERARSTGTGKLKARIALFMCIALLFGSIGVLTSCSFFNDSSMADKAAAPSNWAIYLYLCGSNLETEGAAATSDLNELFAVTLPEGVEVIFQTGGSNEWHNGADASARQIYRYSSEGLEQLESWEQANMGDPQTLVDFLYYCNTNYPAKNRMLLFWDHGGGTLGGVCNDEQFGMDSLSFDELELALSSYSGNEESNTFYEIVGFDACLMANIDTAAIFDDYARYMVASQDVEPGTGWDYVGIAQALANNPQISGGELGRVICDTYYASMSPFSVKTVTLSVVDLTRLDPLLQAYYQLGDEALINASIDQKEYLGAFGRVTHETENFFNSESTGYSNMMDLGDLALRGEQEGLFSVSSRDVLNALDRCVVYQVAGSAHQRAQGLSLFYNYSGKSYALEDYLALSSNRGLNYFYVYNFTGNLTDEVVEYVRQVSERMVGQKVTPEPIDTSFMQSLEGHPLALGPDGQWQLNVGPELGGQLASVYMSQAWVSPGEDEVLDDVNDSLLGLYGFNGFFPKDFQNGVFTADFQADCIALGELPLFTEPINGGSESELLYAAPVLINGVDYSLIISQSAETGAFTLLGATPPIDVSTNMAAKELYQLQPGDKVEAIMCFLLPEGQTDEITGTRLVPMPLGEITYDESAVIWSRPVYGNSEWDTGLAFYAVQFMMIDYAGNMYYSDSGVYQTLDGRVEPVTP